MSRHYRDVRRQLDRANKFAYRPVQPIAIKLARKKMAKLGTVVNDQALLAKVASDPEAVRQELLRRQEVTNGKEADKTDT